LSESCTKSVPYRSSVSSIGSFDAVGWQQYQKIEMPF